MKIKLLWGMSDYQWVPCVTVSRMDIVSGMPDLVFSPIHGWGVLVDFIGII